MKVEINDIPIKIRHILNYLKEKGVKISPELAKILIEMHTDLK